MAVTETSFLGSLVMTFPWLHWILSVGIVTLSVFVSVLVLVEEVIGGKQPQNVVVRVMKWSEFCFEQLVWQICEPY